MLAGVGRRYSPWHLFGNWLYQNHNFHFKVWGLVVHELFESFPKEHSRSTVSLRPISPGVQALRVVSGYQLFSCGGDGTLKWRILNVKNKTWW